MTVSKQNTLGQELDNANPNRIAVALQQVGLGGHFTPVVYDSGVITAVDHITIADLVAAHYANAGKAAPANAPRSALAVRTLRVVASGTAGSVGSYGVTDAGGTLQVPPGGASAALGVAKLSDDGTTITFPNTVTHIVASIVPGSVADPAGAFGEP